MLSKGPAFGSRVEVDACAFPVTDCAREERIRFSTGLLTNRWLVHSSSAKERVVVSRSRPAAPRLGDAGAADPPEKSLAAEATEETVALERSKARRFLTGVEMTVGTASWGTACRAWAKQVGWLGQAGQGEGGATASRRNVVCAEN